MKFFLPETRFAKTCIITLFAALLLSTGLQAQTKKKTAATPAKKTVARIQISGSLQTIATLMNRRKYSER